MSEASINHQSIAFEPWYAPEITGVHPDACSSLLCSVARSFYARRLRRDLLTFLRADLGKSAAMDEKKLVPNTEDLSCDKAQLGSSRRYRFGFQRELVESGRAQMRAQEDQQRFELSVKGADLATWDFDLSEDKLFVDRRWADMCGYATDELPTTPGFWWNLTHPHDRLQILRAWNKTLAHPAERFENEHRIRNKSGEWIWLFVRGGVVEYEEDGAAKRITGVALDMTRAKHIRGRLALASNVFVDAIDPIFITDMSGAVVDLNRAAEHIYGRSLSELLGKTLKTITAPGLEARVDEAYERCLRGEESENIRTIHVTKDGAIVPVLLSLSRLTGETDQTAGIAVIVKTINDPDHEDETIRSEMESLAQSNRHLQEFAYAAAHDLREPLIGLGAYLKLLERYLERRLDDQAEQLLSKAHATVSRMDSLIQGLLWHSRAAFGAKRLEVTDCNVVLEETLSILRSAMENRRADIQSEELPTVMANPSLLGQVFQNLLSNAIRFVREEPLRIRIGAQLSRGEWRFFVKDNGVGIDPTDFIRIFGMFQRVDSDCQRSGTGIGLASCKKIVEYHGGRIWVESKPGRGSTFFFTIPHRIASDGHNT